MLSKLGLTKKTKNNGNINVSAQDMEIYCPSCKGNIILVAGTANCFKCGYEFSADEIAQVGSGGGSAFNPANLSFQKSKLPVKLSITWMIDRTRSSLQFATGIPFAIETMGKEIENKISDSSHNLITCADEDDGQEPELLLENVNFSDVLKTLPTITFEDDGDIRETHLDSGHFYLSTIQSASDPKKERDAVVWALTSETKDSKAGLSPAEIGAEFKRRGILLYLICEPTPSLWELAEAAGAMLIPISNSPDITLLTDIARRLSASIALTIGSGSTQPLQPLS